MVALAASLLARDAAACSCAMPEPEMLSPRRGVAAPLDTKVRVLLPVHRGNGRLELRKVGRGALAVRSTKSSLGELDLIELTPVQPLDPIGQYSVAWIDDTKSPSTLVFGAFRTSSERDSTAPALEALGPAVVHRIPSAIGSMCQLPNPWVEISGVRASDPGRPNAAPLIGVWLANAAGRIDTQKPPTSVLPVGENGVLRISNASLCNPLKFPFPPRGNVVLGIAAVDDAGNASSHRTVRLNLSAARPRRGGGYP